MWTLVNVKEMNWVADVECLVLKPREKITGTSILSWVCIKQKKETVNVVWNTWECVAGRDMKAAALQM